MARDPPRHRSRDIRHRIQYLAGQEAPSDARRSLAPACLRPLRRLRATVGAGSAEHSQSCAAGIHQRRELADDGCIVYGRIAHVVGIHVGLRLLGTHL